MKTDRPILQLKRSRTDIFLDVTSLLLLLCMWSLAFYNYFKLPDIIPIHYGFDGKVTDYGSKAIIWLMPCIGTLLFILFTFLNKYPHTFNYLKKITPENAFEQYSFAVFILRIVKLTLMGVVFIAAIMIMSAKSSYPQQSFKWLIAIISITTFIPVVLAIYISGKLKSKRL